MKYSTGLLLSSECSALSEQRTYPARLYIHGISAGGGTDIHHAVKESLATEPVVNRMRIVVFLSDGYVGNEAVVLRYIRNNIGNSRIYSFGVGTSVNRYLMDGISRLGRGYARYIDPTQDASEVAENFARALKSPLMTDISIDWGDLDVTAITPKFPPDLFSEDSLRWFARYKTGGDYQITLKGTVNGVAAELPLQITLPEVATDTSGQALPLVWARRQIADRNLDYNTQAGYKAKLEREITDLGQAYSLQSRFTSFVAVSEKIYNLNPDASQDASVPVEQVAGVTAHAYPTAIAGSSTPEPETILGLLLALALVALRYWRRLRTAVTGILKSKSENQNAAI